VEETFTVQKGLMKSLQPLVRNRLMTRIEDIVQHSIANVVEMSLLLTLHVLSLMDGESKVKVGTMPVVDQIHH